MGKWVLGAAVAEGLIWGVTCGPACAGARVLGCSGACTAACEQGSLVQWLSSPFYSGKERKVCFPLVAGDRGHFKHHLFDPNSAFKRTLWRLSAAHPGLSDHVASSFSPCIVPAILLGSLTWEREGWYSLQTVWYHLDLCAFFFFSWCPLRQRWGDIYISLTNEDYQDLKIPFRSAVTMNITLTIAP